MEHVTTLPYSRPLTADDLAGMPDDGHRYELIDGTLLVSPAPGFAHQTICVRLVVLLDAAAPGHLRVLTAPFDVRLADDTGVQPDVLVAPRDDFTEKDLRVAPLLVVEVLSPSTALIDLNLKKARYEQAGVASYWVVDPEGPRLRAFELRAGAYVEVAELTGSEEWVASAPFEVRIVPAELLD